MLLSKMPENIREAIGSGNVEKALSVLEDYLKAAKPDLLDDALLVKSKYFKAKEDFELRSVSTREQFERTHARTIMSIQDLLKKAKQNTPVYGAVASNAPVSSSFSRRWIFIAAIGVLLGVASVFVIKKWNQKPVVKKEATTIYYFEDSKPFDKKGKIIRDEKEEKRVDIRKLSRDKYWEVKLKVPAKFIDTPVYYQNDQPAIVISRKVNTITIAVPKEFETTTIDLGTLIKEVKIDSQRTVLDFMPKK